MATQAGNAENEQQGVRWSSQVQEIEPDGSHQSLDAIETITGKKNRERSDLNPEAIQELQQLKTTLRNNIQSSRMQHHAFEPVSLPGSAPASRVPSGTATPSRRYMAAGSTEISPKPSPPQSTVHSPPLTPAGSKSRDGKASIGSVPGFRPAPSDVMTPQRSASPARKPSAPTSHPSTDSAVPSHPKQTPTFSIGPSGDSLPGSNEVSPSGTPASTAPGTPRQRPMTPSSEASDASKAKRMSSGGNRIASMEDRFRFGNRDPKQGYSNSGQAPVQVPSTDTAPRTSASGASLQAFDNSKRSSIFGGAKKDENDSSGEKHHGSKSNLKRFFKFGSSDHHKHHHKEKQRERPTSLSHESNGGDGTQTPPHHAQPSVPFADDHGLQSKYGKFGKMLGSGAGGSVRLMKRSGDGTTFAVKQFRDRHAYESEKEYNKKVTAEFCIGSTLHHGNVIETIDIIHEKGKWYEVMEYAPYDLFATVMTGKMAREEVTCCTLQILSGVMYLHSMGLAHRDLKLDNVVINEHGIMKLIDFGSAVVFRYPFENDVVLATGVVGSDPYLAPEVYDRARYDPRPADIWSIAIIFCCMTLRRFPWKAPRLSDNSYRLFVSPPDADQDQYLAGHRGSAASVKRASMAENGEKRKGGAQSEPASRNPTDDGDGKSQHHHHHHHHHHHESGSKSEAVSRQTTASDQGEKTIKGPIRLLRLLPRETRHIIGRMLDLNPDTRADMDEILADNWVQNALVCRQEEDGIIFKAPNHTHTLQPSSGGDK